MQMPEFTVSPYPYFFIGSFVVAVIVVCILLRKEKIPSQMIFLNWMLVLIMTMFGAVMFGVIRSGFTKSFLEVGFSSLGGAIGLLLGTLIMSFIYPQGKDGILNAFTLVLPLMYGVSKIGCFLIGCCHGIEYHGPMAIKYHNYLVTTGEIFPVQACESILFLLIFAIGVVIYHKKSKVLLPAILGLCAIGKFSLDFLREEHIGKVLSANQYVCIIFLIISIILFIINGAKKGDIYNGT